MWSREVESLGTRSPALLQRDFCCACIVDSEHTHSSTTLSPSLPTHAHTPVNGGQAGVCDRRTEPQQRCETTLFICLLCHLILLHFVKNRDRRGCVSVSPSQ